MRNDNRKFDEIRPVKFVKDITKFADGSVQIELGNTKVICCATCVEDVPPFLKNKGQGWITAEYNMLPTSTRPRIERERSRSSGRTYEIQRIIGRALRTGINLDLLGERTIYIDCDVIQADGGTRTAAITGGFVALYQCIKKLIEYGKIQNENVIKNFIAAVSVGIVNGEKLVDLVYEEDSIAEVDVNLVMNDKGDIVEIQATGEKKAFAKQELDELINLGKNAIFYLINKQKEFLNLI
jgi:ribonuclease PH